MTSEEKPNRLMLAEELEDLRKTIIAAVVIYDHYRAHAELKHAKGKTPKEKFFWSFDALRNKLFEDSDLLSKAFTDDALEELRVNVKAQHDVMEANARVPSELEPLYRAKQSAYDYILREIDVLQKKRGEKKE